MSKVKFEPIKTFFKSLLEKKFKKWVDIVAGWDNYVPLEASSVFIPRKQQKTILYYSNSVGLTRGLKTRPINLPKLWCIVLW